MNTMKRLLLIILTLAFLLTVSSGCSFSNRATKQQLAPAAETAPAFGPSPEPEETPAPTPTPIPAPETVNATVLTQGLTLPYGTLKRGETVSITGEEGDYYRIAYGEDFRGEATITLLVEKRYIRTDGATAEPYTAYAGENACLYATALLEKELQRPARNTALTVLDALEGVLYVSLTGADGALSYGYIRAAEVMETEYVAPVYTAPQYYGSYDSGSSSSSQAPMSDIVIGGGGGGGWSDSSGGGSSGSGGSTSYGYDGGDIAAGSLINSRTVLNSVTMLLRAFTVQACAEEGTLPSSGVCFSDGVPLTLGVLSYGERVAVLKESSAGTVRATVYSLSASGALSAEEKDVTAAELFVNNCIVTVPAFAVQTEGTESGAWTGYIQPNTTGHKASDLSDAGESLATNTEVNVQELGNGLLLVRIPADASRAEEVYYVAPGSVKAEPYVQPVVYSAPSSSYSEPAASTQTYSDIVIGGGGGGGWSDNSGGGSTGGSSEVVASWTEPAL